MEDLPAEAARFYADRLDLLPERFIPMVELVLDEIAKCEPHLPTCHRRALAVRLVVRLHQQYGGSREYWPKPERIARALRDARIWAEYDGSEDGRNGTLALARRHHLPPPRIAAILEAQNALHARRAG